MPKLKPTLKEQISSDKEYWGRMDKKDFTPISQEVFPISAEDYFLAMKAGKKAIKSFQRSVKMSTAQNMPFEKEYQELFRKYTGALNYRYKQNLKIKYAA